jgi:DNA primase RepB-like protein
VPELSNEAAQFLRNCFGDGDWTALLLKNIDAGRSVQRTGSLAWACRRGVQDWLRSRNDARFEVFVSVNALAAGAQSRTRRDVATIRHVLLDVDRNCRTVLRQLERRSDCPQPSYVVHTSPDRVHILWRVRHFEPGTAERLQKRLAADLDCDLAATAVTQMTRLPGFLNHKYSDPYRVWVDYRDVDRVLAPEDFPSPEPGEPLSSEPVLRGDVGRGRRASTERALIYLSHVPAAVAGHHGDLHTFRTCCRIVRGFALDDDDAIAVLAEWNARCQPPWTERELREKIRSARRNGREPIGGMLKPAASPRRRRVIST